MQPHDVFDRHARRRQRDRAALMPEEMRWLPHMIADELADRLSFVKAEPGRALLIGALGAKGLADTLLNQGFSVISADPGFRFAKAASGVQADEDRLPFADNNFHLVLFAGGLDTVNDLPGAFSLAHRILRPNGLLMGAMIGGGLAAWKRRLIDLELAHRISAAPHIHPQVDLRTLGDLLQRAGFTMPVVDQDDVDVRYSSFKKARSESQAMALSNVLSGRKQLSRQVLDALQKQPDLEDQITILNFSAWKRAIGEPIKIGPNSGQRL